MLLDKGKLSVRMGRKAKGPNLRRQKSEKGSQLPKEKCSFFQVFNANPFFG